MACSSYIYIPCSVRVHAYVHITTCLTTRLRRPYHTARRSIVDRSIDRRTRRAACLPHTLTSGMITSLNVQSTSASRSSARFARSLGGRRCRRRHRCCSPPPPELAVPPLPPPPPPPSSLPPPLPSRPRTFSPLSLRLFSWPPGFRMGSRVLPPPPSPVLCHGPPPIVGFCLPGCFRR